MIGGAPVIKGVTAEHSALVNNGGAPMTGGPVYVLTIYIYRPFLLFEPRRFRGGAGRNRAIRRPCRIGDAAQALRGEEFGLGVRNIFPTRDTETVMC